MMNEAELRKFMGELELQLLEEDLNHPAWVVLVWAEGIGRGEPSVFGPMPSELAGSVLAERLSAQLLSAPGRTWAFGDLPVHTQVVPLWSEAEAELDEAS